MTQSHSCHPLPWVIHRNPELLITSWPRVIHAIHSLELFIITLSYPLHHDPESSITSWSLSSRPRVVCVLHIPEMFHFHHHNHLWVALTRHHELESILIGYPFRALSSRPRVILLIYDLESLFLFRVVSSRPKFVFLISDPESFFPFRALSSWPGVIHFIYDPKSFLAFIALSSQPRVVYPIYDLELFILFPIQSCLSYFWPRVVHLVYAQSHSSHPWIWVILFTSFHICVTRHIPFSLYCNSSTSRVVPSLSL